MGEDALAQRVEGLAPQRVVIVMAGIAENVRRALLTAQIDAPVSVLPFPRREHERRYVTELAQILLELRQSDAFLSPPKRLKRRWFGRN